MGSDERKCFFCSSPFTRANSPRWKMASESLCSSDSDSDIDSDLFPNIRHFEPDINYHKFDTYLIVLFAVSKFLG